jgi:TetR/AcrR family transcriptional repressor of nem operon
LEQDTLTEIFMGRTSDAKERLLEVAFDLIWNQSYGAVSVDHICQRAEVNKGSFYHYFPSKSDLAVAAYEEQIPPLNRLRLWCGNAYERQKLKAEKYGHVCGCPYASLGAEVATQDEKIRAKAEELVDRTLRYLENALTEAKLQGAAAIDDPRLMARRVHSLVLGMLLHAKIRNQFSELEDMEPAVMNLIRAKPAF